MDQDFDTVCAHVNRLLGRLVEACAKLDVDRHPPNLTTDVYNRGIVSLSGRFGVDIHVDFRGATPRR